MATEDILFEDGFLEGIGSDSADGLGELAGLFDPAELARPGARHDDSLLDFRDLSPSFGNDSVSLPAAAKQNSSAEAVFPAFAATSQSTVDTTDADIQAFFQQENLFGDFGGLGNSAADDLSNQLNLAFGSTFDPNWAPQTGPDFGSLFGGNNGTAQLGNIALSDDGKFIFPASIGAGFSPNARETISDFEDGNLIDVSAIDANVTIAGNQTFVVDTDGTLTAGEYRITVGANDSIITFNTDGDATVELQITVKGVTDIAAADLIL